MRSVTLFSTISLMGLILPQYGLAGSNPCTAAFSFSPTQKQSFVGQNRGPHAITLDLGVDHEIEDDWLISMAGSLTRSSHGKEVGGDLTMSWLW